MGIPGICDVFVPPITNGVNIVVVQIKEGLLRPAEADRRDPLRQ
jgi:hypothetical protein